MRPRIRRRPLVQSFGVMNGGEPDGCDPEAVENGWVLGSCPGPFGFDRWDVRSPCKLWIGCMFFADRGGRSGSTRRETVGRSYLCLYDLKASVGYQRLRDRIGIGKTYRQF